MKWNYNCSTHTIWTSFDYGDVEAETREEAIEKAKEKITNDLSKVNNALENCDITKGYKVEMDLSQISVEVAK
jgi:hypothetical protein